MTDPHRWLAKSLLEQRQQLLLSVSLAHQSKEPSPPKLKCGSHGGQNSAQSMKTLGKITHFLYFLIRIKFFFIRLIIPFRRTRARSRGRHAECDHLLCTGKPGVEYDHRHYDRCRGGKVCTNWKFDNYYENNGKSVHTVVAKYAEKYDNCNFD